MSDLLDDPIVVSAVALLVIAGGCAIVFYVARSLRDSADDDHQNTQQILENLKDMHLRGEITDEEFRVIKLANQTHAEMIASNTPVSEPSEALEQSQSEPEEPTQT
jgi:hypothetical protein